MRGWLGGQFLPTNIDAIERSFFGEEQNQSREHLRDTWSRERSRKMLFREPDSAGIKWARRDDELVPESAANRSDRAAALDPLRRQLQKAITVIAAELAASGRRLSNSPLWIRLADAATAFHAIVASDPLSVPDQLGNAYALLLQLGRYLETDLRVQRDIQSSDIPLDPETHGLLTDLVRTAAPWLRGFPTIAKWDDAAGKLLVPGDLVQTAHEFFRIAHKQAVISDEAADELKRLGDASEGTDDLGEKAGNRYIASARNLMIATAEIVSASLAGIGRSDPSSRTHLAQRAAVALAAAEREIDAASNVLPSDLALALRALIKTVRTQQ